MLGGGTFTAQNKVLPGSYINFVSAGRASAALSERGIVAIPLELDWGPEKTVFTVEAADFEKNARNLFGYAYHEDALRNIRELLLHARTAVLYRLNGGDKASNTYAVAKYSGTRGNQIQIIIRANAEDGTKFDVLTMLDVSLVDTQTVSAAAELQDNEFAVFKKDAELKETAGLVMSGGTNGPALTGDDYQTYLDRMESQTFHTLGCLSEEEAVKRLFAAFTERMRDEMGVKFQTVLHDAKADHEGIVNVKNTVTDAGTKGSELVCWTAGILAGCAVNRTVTNALYDGEYTVNVDYRQSELVKLIQSGYFVFHRQGTEIRVLEDINSFTSYTEKKNADFAENQVIRVLDQVGNDIAVTFNTRYLGKVQNNDAGRTGLWNDIASYCRQLERIRAIEDFSGEDIVIEKGKDKKSVTVACAVTPVCAMSKLYMTVTVR